jgi:F420-dependent oxidoreductase-like protein
MRACLMIEGQEGVTWDQWRALAATAEEHGFEALFRSDHYESLDGTAKDGSLDAWATINALAAITSTIRLGTLVSPATFRHPSTLAREVVTADHVSNGRIELGLGAAWHEGEHRAHGFPFDPVKERFDRFAEQLEIVSRSWATEPFDFEGRYYRLEHADPRPKPLAKPNLIVGGSARPRSAALAARWADEYNTVYATLDECRERRERVAQACADQGRDPIPFSLMTSFAFDADPADHSPGMLVGSSAEIVTQLRKLEEEAGVGRVMLQHLQHHDLEVVKRIGREIIPAVG